MGNKANLADRIRGIFTGRNVFRSSPLERSTEYLREIQRQDPEGYAAIEHAKSQLEKPIERTPLETAVLPEQKKPRKEYHPFRAVGGFLKNNNMKVLELALILGIAYIGGTVYDQLSQRSRYDLFPFAPVAEIIEQEPNVDDGTDLHRYVGFQGIPSIDPSKFVDGRYMGYQWEKIRVKEGDTFIDKLAEMGNSVAGYDRTGTIIKNADIFWTLVSYFQDLNGNPAKTLTPDTEYWFPIVKE